MRVDVAIAMSERRLADAVAPILVGAMFGAMIAARLESATLCLGVALAAALVIGTRLPARGWFVAMGIGSGIAIALNLYLTPGRAMPGPQLFHHAPSREGLRQGALLSLRLAGAGVALLGLRRAWPGERAADELGRWLAPLERLRVPVREARAMVGLSLRFAPLIGGEARRISALQDLRAGRPPRGLGEWIVRRRAVVIPTFVCALERAERVALSLEARHYRLRPLPPAAERSRVWGAIGVAIAGASLLWRR